MGIPFSLGGNPIDDREAARCLLSSPDALLAICQGDAAAVRGARIILGAVARGELGALAARSGREEPSASPNSLTELSLDRLGDVEMAVTAGEED